MSRPFTTGKEKEKESSVPIPNKMHQQTNLIENERFIAQMLDAPNYLHL
jgi:hypothetical protein